MEKDWRQEWQKLEAYVKTIERQAAEQGLKAGTVQDFILELGKVHTAVVILGYMGEHGEEVNDDNDK